MEHLCYDCKTMVVEREHSTCSHCDAANDRRHRRNQVKRVRHQCIFNDHLTKHTDANIIASALQDRSMSAMPARGAWQDHLDWTLIMHLAHERAEETALMNGYVSGMELLDQAACKHLVECQLMELTVLSHIDTGHPCGSGYVLNTDGAKVARGLIDMRVPHRIFDAHFEDDVRGNHQGANDLLAQVFKFLHDRRRTAEAWKKSVGAMASTAQVAEGCNLPKVAAAACLKALTEKRVVERRGTRYQAIEWKFIGWSQI